MRTHSIHNGIFAADPLLEWAGDLRAEVLGRLTPDTIGAIAGIAVTGVVSSATVAGVLAALEGGTTMTSTAIGATSHTAAKLAAGGLAATLTAGGAAAVTGSLPDSAQRFTADAAAHIGLSLPRPEAAISGIRSIDLSVGDVVTVGGAGRVGIRLDGEGLILTGIEGSAGFTSRVVAETSDAIIVEFRSATETTSVLLTRVNDQIASSVTTSSLDATADGEAEEWTDAQADTEADADAETEAEVDAELHVNIGG